MIQPILLFSLTVCYWYIYVVDRWHSVDRELQDVVDGFVSPFNRGDRR